MINVKWCKPGSGQRSHVFTHMWKLDLKDKHIHKYINGLTYIYVHTYIERKREHDCNSKSNWGDYMEAEEGREQQWITLKSIASVYKDSIRKCSWNNRGVGW
jgi:hypothetical protein